jgi:LmbE family N-acetylglucosaminyl deacetylase
MKMFVGAVCVLVGLLVHAKESIVFVCAHPDDFGGISGTGMRLAEKFDVHVIDYTHGERGLGEEGYLNGTVRKMRTVEEENACKVAGATLHWMEEIDGEAAAGMETCRKLAELLKTLNPRAVIAHWPIDTHMDHVMSTAATLKAIQLSGLKPEIYFQEQHHQSRSYRPVFYVDISSVKARKDELIRCYKCQWPEAMVERKTADAKAYAVEVGMELAETLAPMAGTVSLGRCIFNEIDNVKVR